MKAKMHLHLLPPYSMIIPKSFFFSLSPDSFIIPIALLLTVPLSLFDDDIKFCCLTCRPHLFRPSNQKIKYKFLIKKLNLLFRPLDVFLNRNISKRFIFLCLRFYFQRRIIQIYSTLHFRVLSDIVKPEAIKEKQTNLGLVWWFLISPKFCLGQGRRCIRTLFYVLFCNLNEPEARK